MEQEALEHGLGQEPRLGGDGGPAGVGVGLPQVQAVVAHGPVGLEQGADAHGDLPQRDGQVARARLGQGPGAHGVDDVRVQREGEVGDRVERGAGVGAREARHDLRPDGLVLGQDRAQAGLGEQGGELVGQGARAEERDPLGAQADRAGAGRVDEPLPVLLLGRRRPGAGSAQDALRAQAPQEVLGARQWDAAAARGPVDVVGGHPAGQVVEELLLRGGQPGQDEGASRLDADLGLPGGPPQDGGVSAHAHGPSSVPGPPSAGRARAWHESAAGARRLPQPVDNSGAERVLRRSRVLFPPVSAKGEGRGGQEEGAATASQVVRPEVSPAAIASTAPTASCSVDTAKTSRPRGSWPTTSEQLAAGARK